MKVLIIEDNIEISNNIKKYLELEGYKIDVCNDWECWLDKAKQWTYDVILLDLMLPLIDWYSIAKKLHWRVFTPIIMITAKESIDDKLKWFENWAIDYIIKPFDLRELEARIKIATKKNDNIIYLWDLELDFKDRVFKNEWIEINIAKTEFEILNLLFENKERVVSRAEIIEEIWWEKALFDSDSKLDVYISTIRNKLNKNIIKTSKWIWYKFNLNI